MFTEILKIKPVLDPASAAKMERTLTQRFSRAAKQFGRGLNNIIKGTALGISVGLLAKILNPLQEIEDKVKRLLGEGDDLSERAARFGTDAGMLKAIQDAFYVEGVKPDQFNSMIESFTKAVEDARIEIRETGRVQSERTSVVERFAQSGETDFAKLFFQFMGSLRDEGLGQGRDIFTTEREQRRELLRRQRGESLSPEERQKLVNERQIVRLSGLESRQAFEREIFGNQLYGAAARVIEKDLENLLEEAKTPVPVNDATKSLSESARLSRVLEIQRQNEDYIKAASDINGKVVAIMDKMEKNTLNFENKQLKAFEELAKGAIAAQEITNLLKTGLTEVTKAIGSITSHLADLVKRIDTLPFFRGGR